MNKEDAAITLLIKAKRFIDNAIVSLMGRDSNAAKGEVRGASITIERTLDILKGGEGEDV